MRVVNARTEPFEIGGEEFHIVMFEDSEEPEMTFFQVYKGDKLFPLKVLGGQLSFVTFQLSDEVRFAANQQGQMDVPAELIAEAKRMIEVTLRG